MTMALPYSECTYRILIGLTLFWMRIPFSEYSEPILIDHGLTIFWILLPNSDWSYLILNALTVFWLVFPYSECAYHIVNILSQFWLTMALPYSEYSYPILIGLTLLWTFLPYSDWSYHILNALTLYIWVSWPDPRPLAGVDRTGWRWYSRWMIPEAWGRWPRSSRWRTKSCRSSGSFFYYVPALKFKDNFALTYFAILYLTSNTYCTNVPKQNFAVAAWHWLA